MDQQTAHRILSGEAGGAYGLLRAGLCVLSGPYSLAVRARRWGHRKGIIPGDSLAQYKRPGSGHPIRVISVGNLTTGGTGKTPMVAWVAHRLRAMGLRPGVLLRGYKGGAGGSDEARLLKELCGDCPVVANPNRLAGAMEAMAGGADVMVLDDGFQHLRLRRDLDIVLIDATNPFGYGHCLPRGLLREPPGALRYADDIVITRSDAISPGDLLALRQRLARLAPLAGIHQAVHMPTHFLEGTTKRPTTAVAGRKVFAFCGIGNPRSFFAAMEGLGAEVVGRMALDDHAEYTVDRVKTLRENASEAKAELLVTTRKDGVKLKDADLGLPLWQLIIEIQLARGEAVLVEMIRHACGEVPRMHRLDAIENEYRHVGIVDAGLLMLRPRDAIALVRTCRERGITVSVVEGFMLYPDGGTQPFMEHTLSLGEAHPNCWELAESFLAKYLDSEMFFNVTINS
jgi:tetraacyldisaccharide 4'-kinase